VSVTGNQVSFDLNGTFLVSKLIDGNYPNFRQVIPSETKECVDLDREPLLNAVHRVALLTSDKSRSIKLTFGKNNLEIAANTPEVGEAHESIPIKYSGPEISIAFDPEFFMAPLRNLPNDTVQLHLTDEISPGVMKVKAPFLYVIMPMRMH
jgi:DNA polymerase-3 subunit beta